VVGAGLVGTVLSVYLKRRGYEVDVYERLPDIRENNLLSGRSINITLCERGFRSLDAIGVGDAVRAISVPAYGRVIHDIAGNLAYQPYGNNGEAIYSVSRNELNKTLLDFAEHRFGVRLQFGEKCAGIDLSVPTITFENTTTGRATTERADKVFGADGARSAVRYQMQKQWRFNYSQQYWEQGYKELHVPASNNEWTSKKNALHIWPRGNYMLIGFPNTDGSFTCSLHIPFEGKPSYQSITNEAELTGFFDRSFPDAAGLIPDLARDFFANPPNPMVTIKCSPWTFRDKVALIGDSAHSIYPSYGQGSNAGFEDCAVLDHCLDEYHETWPAVFFEYERLRKPNTDAIADLCVEHFIELRDLVGDPGFLLKKELERKINLLHPDKYRDLYSMISFTCMPYLQALETEREQRRIIERIMKVERIEERLDSPEVESLIDDLMAGRSAALHGQ
jgi:kynurenine 3-monooxygenase